VLGSSSTMRTRSAALDVIPVLDERPACVWTTGGTVTVESYLVTARGTRLRRTSEE
jgi:hypothetical protein